VSYKQDHGQGQDAEVVPQDDQEDASAPQEDGGKVKRKRTKRSGLSVGDRALARCGDDWCPGTVSRSVGRGAEVDVRLDDGRVIRNLTSKDVKEVKDSPEKGNI
jgi:hypothetical protein